MAARTVVLAYSGGLDTSYCVLALRERGFEVVAVTVDTGGFEPGELERIGDRARRLGAREFVAVDARDEVYRDYVSYVIKGNILRGGVYPLCVAAERVAQAAVVARLAKERGAQAVAHGSTGAGNDQVRFDAAFRTLAPELEVIAPIREQRVSRAESSAKLREAGIEVEQRTTDLSINVSLWGTTIGGRELHDPWKFPESDVWRLVVPPERADPPTEIVLRFEQGLPVAIDGEALPGPELIARLNDIAGRRGVGRGIHVGDTILGIKGRIAFEAPAPIVLIAAHSELEKLVLTRWQAFWKERLSAFYGDMLHRGLWFDPAMRDIEALIDRSQRRVTGEVRVYLGAGRHEVRGCRSPHTLFAQEIATYGEDNAWWDGRDAEGFCKLYPLQAVIANATDPERAASRQEGA